MPGEHEHTQEDADGCDEQQARSVRTDDLVQRRVRRPVGDDVQYERTQQRADGNARTQADQAGT